MYLLKMNYTHISTMNSFKTEGDQYALYLATQMVYNVDVILIELFFHIRLSDIKLS